MKGFYATIAALVLAITTNGCAKDVLLEKGVSKNLVEFQLSANELPNTSKMQEVKLDKEATAEILDTAIIQRSYTTTEGVLAFTFSLRWKPEVTIAWLWSVPLADGHTKFYIALSQDKIAEMIDQRQLFFALFETVAEEVMSVTTIILDKYGQTFDSKTFNKP